MNFIRFISMFVVLELVCLAAPLCVLADTDIYRHILGDLAGKKVVIVYKNENKKNESLKGRIVQIDRNYLTVQNGEMSIPIEICRILSIKEDKRRDIAFKPVYIAIGIGLGFAVAMGIVSATAK